MEFVSKIHGKINYEENNIITFKKGIPGFNDLKKFILVDLEEYEPFKLLHSLEDDEVALIVASPYDFKSDYEIVLSDDTISRLEIKDPKEVMLVVTITLHSDVRKITMNLQGPMVINTSNNLGEQIVLDNSKYDVKTPIVAEV